LFRRRVSAEVKTLHFHVCFARRKRTFAAQTPMSAKGQ
jgi:hypothetical protein